MFTREAVLRVRPRPILIAVGLTVMVALMANTFSRDMASPKTFGRPVPAATLKSAVVGACEEKNFVQTTSCYLEAKVPCNGKTAAECALFSWLGGCPAESSWAQSDCGPQKGKLNLVSEYCAVHFSGMCVWAESTPAGSGVCQPGTPLDPEGISCGTKEVTVECRD